MIWMLQPEMDILRRHGGIRIYLEDEREEPRVSKWVLSQLLAIGGSDALSVSTDSESGRRYVQLQLHEEVAARCAPGGNTAHLRQKFNLNPQHHRIDLEREILLSMLVCPVPYEFPSYAEFRSTIRIRSSIVQAACRTRLAFATHEAERPPNYWSYDEDRGFILRPGRSLIAGLEKATQAGNSDRLYTFSCRRATEYILLLGVAREARICNPVLYQRLHQQAETRALKGAEFERAFVRTLGSADTPLPLRYFVPGDRTWFRNTDSISADVTGYEGSWTFYLGGGLFADFWRRSRVFTLESKVVCLYHWRNATYRDSAGELQIDETRVNELVEQTLQRPADTQRILRETLCLQKPLGTDGGGSIEAHREHSCRIHPGTADIVLPDIV